MKIVKYIILISMLSLGGLCAEPVGNVDSLIVKAIYYSKKNPQKAAIVWKKLFELTNNEKYLVEYFYASLQYKDIKDVIKELKAVLSKKKSKELYELLGSLYSQDGDEDGVIEVISDLSDGNVESMYELAYLYSLKKKDKQALKVYKKIYKIEHSWKSLKGILSILVRDNRIKEASNILWSAMQKDKLPKEAYLVYAGLIDFKKDTDKAIFALKKLYKLTGEKKYIKELISLYIYKKDYDSLVTLLENTHYDDKLLYELYLSNGEKVEAYKLLFNLYKNSKNPKWLAEKAMLTFEITKKYKAVDKRVLNSVSKLFEKSFALGYRDPMAFNYYGYTLIDENMDVKKGISYVKKALNLKPKNAYYLDSLAWGYYKMGKCKEAKSVMQKIKNLGEIKEEDILKHNKLIEQCKEK